MPTRLCANCDVRWAPEKIACPICERATTYLTFQNPDNSKQQFERYYASLALTELHVDLDDWTRAKLC